MENLEWEFESISEENICIQYHDMLIRLFLSCISSYLMHSLFFHTHVSYKLLLVFIAMQDVVWRIFHGKKIHQRHDFNNVENVSIFKLDVMLKEIIGLILSNRVGGGWGGGSDCITCLTVITVA